MLNNDENELIGVYRFYQDGQLIGECKNALTAVGRTLAIRAILGYGERIADSIALGIGASANTLNSASTLIVNNSLNFEVARVPINGTDVEISTANNALLFYGTIDDQDQYQIREVGLFPSPTLDQSTSLDGSLIFNFDQVDTFLKFGNASAVALQDSASSRIGTQMLVTASGDATSNYIEKRFDFTGLSGIDAYSSEDTFRLAAFNTASTTASINFRFFSDATNYFTLTMLSASGYTISSATKGSAVQTGTPNWQSINSIRIWVSSPNTVLLDGLKIDSGSYLIDTNFGMVSRAVLPTPIIKRPSIPVVVQYSLLMNFSGGV